MAFIGNVGGWFPLYYKLPLHLRPRLRFIWQMIIHHLQKTNGKIRRRASSCAVLIIQPMKKPLIALLHIGYWFVFLILSMMMTYALSSNEDLSNDVTEEVLAAALFFIILLPAIITFYTFYLVLFPRYFRQKQIGYAFLLGVVISIGTTSLGFGFMSGFLYPQCAKDMNIPEAITFVTIASFFSLVGGTIAFVIKGFSTWFEEVKLKEALQDKNHAMELALVKSQLDPHFLFNTINNIDVLILKDAAEASDYLNRLSDIMRFMLYETKTEEILLSKEVNYIRKYIDLQKIRTANTTYVDFQLSGDVNGRKIAPMLFIPFIENAFKHTLNKKTEDAIRIHIRVEKDQIHMSCINRLEKHRRLKTEDGGLGNELIRKRLELLYPNRHQLDTQQNEAEYQVQLTINS